MLSLQIECAHDHGAGLQMNGKIPSALWAIDSFIIMHCFLLSLFTQAVYRYLHFLTLKLTLLLTHVYLILLYICFERFIRLYIGILVCSVG